jgi:hypothetical protein
MTKHYTVDAVVHKPVGSGFRVKASVRDLGLYINGMMVFPPNTEEEEWMVFTPAQRAGRGKYVHSVEFNKKLPLWAEIYDACVDAGKQALSEEGDVVLEDIEPFDDDDFKDKLDNLSI